VSQSSGNRANRVPVVMSTVRIARHWIHTGRGSVGIDRRGLIITTFLCAALFACFFALGRAASPGSGPRDAPPPSLPVAYAGTAIPIRLSSAPAIEMQAVPNARVRTQTTPSRQAPGTEASPALSPAAPQLPVPAPALPVAAPAPASAQGSGGGQSKPHTSGSTSFDSSG
jgi:hypothetical protein